VDKHKKQYLVMKRNYRLFLLIRWVIWNNKSIKKQTIIDKNLYWTNLFDKCHLLKTHKHITMHMKQPLTISVRF